MSKKIKIETMDYLVDVYMDNLNEQMFSPSTESARVKGEANVSWTGCVDRRCGKEKNKYSLALCKEYCKRDAASEALSRVRGLSGYCDKSKNPRSCVKSLRRTADAWSHRITRIDKRIADIKRDLDKFKAQAAGR